MGLARRHDVDFLRAVAFGLLIPYHASLIYNSKPFLIKSPDSIQHFDLVQVVLHPWRMLLLFIISGMATAFIGRKMAGESFALDRTKKLLVPFTLGMLILIPPQELVRLKTQAGLDLSMSDMILAVLRIEPIVYNGEIVTFGHPQHLWFLLYLWAYTAGLLLLVNKAPAALARMRQVLIRQLYGAGLLVYPIAFFSLARYALHPIFEESLSLFTDWYAHTIYMAAFVAGYLLAFETAVWDNMVAQRRKALLVAAVALALNVGEHAYAGTEELHPLVRSTYQWSALVAIFGYARTYITGPSKVVSYLNRGILTYYVLHQTIMVLFAYWLVSNGWLTLVAFVLLNIVTAALCLGVYEVYRVMRQRH